jgi:UDP-glucose 4-epimerase
MVTESSCITNHNILVTGGAGFIGSHFVDLVLELQPKKVVVVDNFFLGNETNIGSASKNSHNLIVIRADSTNFCTMQDILKNHQISVVYNFATIPLPASIAYSSFTIDTNIQSVTTLCELAKIGTFQKLVNVSSSEVYGTGIKFPMNESHPLNPTTPYAASKASADLIVTSYVRTFGINAFTVRPFNNFGERQNFKEFSGLIPTIISNVTHNLPIQIHGDGKQTRDYIYVLDTVKYILELSENDGLIGMTVNIGSGTETSVNTLVAQILRLMKKEDHEVKYTKQRNGDVARHQSDNQLLITLLGSKPPGVTDENLSKTINWYQSKFKEKYD